ncbi:TNF receptor-associated factor 4-like [Dysidea avara]|uniref:TNF receptor-associated factor 4-like n=1 Tax=Dysidea avara TaxID=196820 RepID=UPI00332C13D3
MATGGYEYEFTAVVPDRLVCKVCHQPSRNPHLSECCGHTFCKSCVDEVKDSYHNDCPMCRNEEFSTILNKQIDREVKGLTVHCTNSEDGCTWSGEVRALSAHRGTCDYEMVQCEYHGIGCEEEMYRKDLSDHNKENAQKHLALSVTELKNLRQFTHQLMMGGLGVVRSWPMQLDSLSTMTETSGDLVCPVVVKVPEFTSKKRDKEEWYSNSFYSHNRGYKMCLRVDPSGNDPDPDDDDDDNAESSHMSVYLYLMKGPYDDELTWPLREEFEVKLLNQISDCEHHLDTIDYDNAKDDTAGRVTDGEKAEGWGESEFISHEDLLNDDPICQYVKNDCVFLQVSKL